jgi:hypothetical protein
MACKNIPLRAKLHTSVHTENNEMTMSVKHQINARYIKYKTMSEYLLETDDVCRKRMGDDFIYVLFYESNRGNLMLYFQYIKVFLFDCYLYPKSHDHNEMDVQSPMNGKPFSPFESILLNIQNEGFDEKMKKKRAGKYIERNESCIRLILKTLESIEERVEFDEYVNYKADLNNANFSNVIRDDTTLTQKEKDVLELMESMSEREREILDKKVMSNLNIAKYLTSCNWCYFHLRYLILVCIGSDDNIAAYLGKMCDQNKYKNFPLYINILLKEVENKPFNNINSSSIISEFLEDCMNFYYSGVVKNLHASKFYNHRLYKRD